MKLGIVGGGPAGYTAAIRAAQLGADVTLYEAGDVGGVCLNRGCIPTKAMLKTAEAIATGSRILDLTEGTVIGTPSLSEIAARARQATETFRDGLERILAARGVDVVRIEAAVPAARTIERSDGTTDRVDAIVIATGSAPVVPGPLVGDQTVTGEGFFDREGWPSRVVIVGGGVQGVEFATFYGLLGLAPVLVEMEDRLLPILPSRYSARIAASLVRLGVDVRAKTRVERLETTDGGVHCLLGDGDVVEADMCLVAIGRRARLERIGLELERDASGFLVTDATGRTSVPDVYACGDVSGGALLASAAYAQGAAAALMAITGEMSGSPVVPACCFSHPEIAWVGAISSNGRRISVPYGTSGKAFALDVREGVMDLFVDEDGIARGAVCVGAEASELINTMSFLIANGVTAREVESIAFIHPSLSELIAEAFARADGRPHHTL